MEQFTVDDLRRSAQVVYLACEESVADDLSKRLLWAVDHITSNDSSFSPISEDEKLYYSRTLLHIHRVQKNMFYLLINHADTLKLNFEDRRILAHTVMNHDRSKFSVTQHKPYIALTKYYDQRKNKGNPGYEYPDPETKSMVATAVQHHYYSENHHPERLGGNVSEMTKFDLIEVCCDLQAMAQEFQEPSGRKYYNEVWAKKHRKVESSRWFMELIFGCFEEQTTREVS